MYIRDFQERKKFERYFFSWAAIIATSALLLVMFFGVLKLWQRERSVKVETAVLEQKIAQAKAEREAGAQKLEALKTPEGMEEEARSRFNLKQNGEEMVLFLENNKNENKEDFWKSSKYAPAQIWQTIKNWLKF